LGGQFHLAFGLPEAIDEESTRASLRNGVYRVVLAKASNSRHIEIKTSQTDG
jgi:HSP20 family molecular chaperone IbpA